METNQEEKKSPAYLRTHEAICQALCRLLQDHSMEQITVQDILNETPVTRTTFYKHFSDKYAAGEYILDYYLNYTREIKKELCGLPVADYSAYIRRSAQRFRYDFTAMQKIHSYDKDLRSILSEEYYRQYMDTDGSDRDPLTAEIYSQALTTFQLFSEQESSVSDRREMYNRCMINAFLQILELKGDRKLENYLRSKVDSDR